MSESSPDPPSSNPRASPATRLAAPLTVREGGAVLAALRGEHPFIVLRDEVGDLVLRPLAPGPSRLTLGREGDIALPWDARASRVHAELATVGTEWTVVDDGLSLNGTFVNGERVRQRRRLRDGDALRVGETVLVYRVHDAPAGDETRLDESGARLAAEVTSAQRAVLVALCRPMADSPLLTSPPPTTTSPASSC